ncbi:MAG: hypothetical protein NTY46_06945 [Candidatus Sumerlaeota bacterium]|nr:hypothetical protein [Candidatus Sumerlaeota bacterium]
MNAIRFSLQLAVHIAAAIIPARNAHPVDAIPVDITIETRAKPLNTFVPDQALGGTFDGHSRNETLPLFSPVNMEEMKGAGLRAITYRLRTELAIQTWHWNQNGKFSGPEHNQGYWVSDPAPGPPLGITHGYRLPRRGSSSDQADDDGFSRILDDNPATFWKSNPYLDERFTGEPNSRHLQWIAIRLDKVTSIDALEIMWGFPHATSVTLQSSLSSKDFDYMKPGDWQTLDITVPAPQGGRQIIRFGRTVEAIQWRILMLPGPATTSPLEADPACADIRDCLGCAVQEIRLGRLRDDGEIEDILAHSRRGDRQTRICVSSTDPWHRDRDLDSNAEQAGWDLIYKCPLVERRPMLVSFGLLYDTPENAVNALKYLKTRGYPIAGIELGEEPDGQFTEPGDYAALYLQFVDALRNIDAGVKIGGPSFQTEYNEDKPFRTAPDPESWYSQFITYLKSRSREKDFQFFSFEWYPFDSVCKPAAPQIVQSADRLKGILNEWKLDGLSSAIPWIITEYHYSRFGGQAEMDMEGALICAEVAPLFLSIGGDRAYFDQLEPGTMVRGPECASWGNQLMLLADDNGQLRGKLAAYWAMQLVATRWVEAGERTHEIYPVQCSLDPAVEKGRLSVFAVKRPDGLWGLLLINKDPDKSLQARLAFDYEEANSQLTRKPLTLDQFSREQYEWRPQGENGYPSRSLPPQRSVVAGSSVNLPPYSVSVVLIDVRPD